MFSIYKNIVNQAEITQFPELSQVNKVFKHLVSERQRDIVDQAKIAQFPELSQTSEAFKRLVDERQRDMVAPCFKTLPENLDAFSYRILTKVIPDMMSQDFTMESALIISEFYGVDADFTVRHIAGRYRVRVGRLVVLHFVQKTGSVRFI